jgi:hypothetical protein
VSTPTYAAAGWFFRRLLGIAYLFAFWSLAQQVTGLIGRDGILPAAGFLDDVRSYAEVTGIGADRYRLVPSLLWLSPSDATLQGLTLAGVGLAAVLIAGLAPAVVLPLLWICYLSVSSVGGDWMSYQWDALLLETGLLACFVGPLRWFDRLRDAPDLPRATRALLWWLLFRLMFGSGLVKLASGDPTWRDLTALAVHYETQPLPTPLAWYASQLPLWFDRASTAAVLAIELLLPWFIVFGARARRLAAVGLTLLQVLIALTGNYTFFNLLTVALLVTLLDDRGLLSPGPSVMAPSRVLRRASVAAALLIVPVSISVFASQLRVRIPVVSAMEELVRPFSSINRYGLFAVMTTTRPEIILEGSSDGATWIEYEFRHKPGDVTRAPTWIAPFQPRLDWQMWFAALGRYEDELWFQRFCERLLEGKAPVTRLLSRNPFPAAPPRYLRATLYRYRFTSGGDGAWWTRERMRGYMPVLSLE